jgi:HSP20 family protein
MLQTSNPQLSAISRELRREVDRLFDDFWSLPPSRTGYRSANQFQPACEIEESENYVLVALDIPGIPKDQIKVEVVDGQVAISGERRAERKVAEKAAWHSERSYGKFYRIFALPPGLDAERIEANYEDGVLQLYIPKAESAKPRQIKVSNSSSPGFFAKLIGQSSVKGKDERSSSGDPKTVQVA